MPSKARFLDLSQELSRISLAGHEIISLDSNQNPCPLGRGGSPPLQPPGRIKLGRGQGEYSPGTLASHGGFCLGGWFGGCLVRRPALPAPSCHCHNMEGGWPQGPGVLTAREHGWETLCQEGPARTSHRTRSLSFKTHTELFISKGGPAPTTLFLI